MTLSEAESALGLVKDQGKQSNLDVYTTMGAPSSFGLEHPVPRSDISEASTWELWKVCYQLGRV